ncbi:hypothetical protein C8R43DRAFT_965398 [Mycena crocata]|nr:hypothetical protein C8R43DRAFT_965398 [Mycena crocata]
MVPPASFLLVYYKLLGKYQHPPTSATALGKRISFAASPLPVLGALDIMLQHSLIPDDVVPDLWPRMWNCMTMQIPYLSELGVEDLDLGLDGKSANPTPIIDSTPGIRAHITRLWAYFLHHKDLWRSSHGPSADVDLSRILSFFFEDPIRTDIIDAAGGTYLDLASLVIKHVNMATYTVSRTGAHKAHLHFIDFLQGRLVGSFDMVHALEALDFITHLKKLSLALWPITDPDLASQLLEGFLPLINKQLAIYPGPRDGIDARLLVLLARCAIAGVGHEENAITNILGGILPGTLSFYGVLSRVEKALGRIDELRLTSGLRHSAIWGYCAAQSLLKPTYYNAPGAAACRIVPLCVSRRIGKRESIAINLQTLALDWYLEFPHLPARERAFLRYLVHHDYLAHKHQIFEQCADFYTHYGRDEPMYTKFNYVDGALAIEVLPVSALLSALKKEDLPRGRHEIARLARSAGTMHLHVAVVANAGWGRYICCPMRTLDATVSLTLKALGGKRSTREYTEKRYQVGIQSHQFALEAKGSTAYVFQSQQEQPEQSLADRNGTVDLGHDPSLFEGMEYPASGREDIKSRGAEEKRFACCYKVELFYTITAIQPPRETVQVSLNKEK